MFRARKLVILVLASCAAVSDASSLTNNIRHCSSPLLQVRGGGWAGRRLSRRVARRKSNNDSAVQTKNEHTGSRDQSGVAKSLPRKLLPWAGAAAIISLLFIEYAENINAYVVSLKPEWMDVEAFKAKLLDTLTDVNKNGGPRGLGLYMVFLSLWAACGLTTLPVESSAGMAFGWRKGLLMNVMGKMSGSLLAYGIGRIFLEEYVVSSLEGKNEVFGLVETAVAQKPYRTSVLVRLFPFPELVKNLGLSILPPVQLGVFLAATFTHTFPFTLLWTYLGCDTVAHMRDASLAPNRVLAAVLVAVTAFGVFGSPALAALFVRSMKLEHDKAAAQKK
mmetsp:Transcript_32205/g.94797  ORF Transcript_32205/g.94797 Transcript_32205/m.94797 type:complete len:334 (-) Transcript_32205:1933-2934(-)